MSLVAAYGDSDSDNSNNSDDENENATNNILKHSTTAQTTTESSTEDEEEEMNTNLTLTSLQSQETKTIPTTTQKLPTPGFLGKDNNGYLPTTSVFSNPFVEAEKAKKMALEKHVKMVDGGAAITINGKKVCWNYRKGRCRFGHNCKYAHDSDLQKSAAQLAAEQQIQETVICQSENAGPPLKRANQRGSFVPSENSISDEETDNGIKNNKRRRPGLTQGLQPGKKVLKQYQKLKNH